MRFTFCMPVWGERYVRVMLDAGLPSQLGKNNLEKFPWLKTSIYEIYTTTADAEKIKTHPVFKKLSKLMEIKFVIIDDIISDRKWSMLRYCHREAVKSADSRMSVLYFLHPDQIWTDGSFCNAAKRISEGFTAVLCPGPRSFEEQMIPALRKKWLSADGTSISVPPRELVRLGMTHLHREMKMWFWHDPEYYRNPTYLFFKVGHIGIAAFCYIMHPVALNVQVRNAPFNRIFDQDYLANSCPDVEKIYVCRDSDEIFHFEVSPIDMAIPPTQEFYEDKIESMSCYGEYQYNKQHRKFVREPVRIHSGPIDDAEWRMVEEEGRRIVDAIDANWALSDTDLLETRPLNLIRRLDGRYRFDKSSVTEQDAENRRKAVEKLGSSYVEGGQANVANAKDEIPKSDKTESEQNPIDRIYNSHPGVYIVGPGTDKYGNIYEENTHISDRTLIFGECYIGRQTELHGVTLYPRTRVGRYCSIARNAALGASNHPISGVTTSIKNPSIEQMLNLVGAEIGHDVWIGTNATVMAGVTIGHGAVIGANAVVTKSVRPYAIMVGQPAREIRRRFPDDVCQALLVSRWWELPHETITELPMADVRETLRRVVALRREAANIEPEAIEYLEQWLAESETAPSD